MLGFLLRLIGRVGQAHKPMPSHPYGNGQSPTGSIPPGLAGTALSARQGIEATGSSASLLVKPEQRVAQRNREGPQQQFYFVNATSREPARSDPGHS
jgi:hypothetical protein